MFIFHEFKDELSCSVKREMKAQHSNSSLSFQGFGSRSFSAMRGVTCAICAGQALVNPPPPH